MITIMLSIASAVLYRLGGWEHGNKMYRRIGCPLLCLIYMVFNVSVPWYIHLISFGLMFVAVTTYWDEI